MSRAVGRLPFQRTEYLPLNKQKNKVINIKHRDKDYLMNILILSPLSVALLT